jgi:hypothetical protein
MPPVNEADRRPRIRDGYPYEAPARLSDLRGPRSGTVQLPITVAWGPNRIVDLSDREAIRWAYSYLITEGSQDQQRALLNASLIREFWPELVLAARVRELWTSRFAELR